MTLPVPPELQSKITLWRQRAGDGTITLEEMKEAILALRQGRKNALAAALASKSKAKKPVRNVDDMLAEL